MKYLFAAILLVSFSCSQKEKEGDDSEWKQMDDFHTIMADVYHPLKDSNNLAPIKRHVEELAASATKWAEAELPMNVDNDEMKERLAMLKNHSEELVQTVKGGGADELIATQLTTVHNNFHEIMEAWYKTRKEEHHEHH